ncbi:MAG: hypothetical protein Q4G58_06205 [bacterium]|nr:hypothetical protein [bacterium]
MWQRKLKRNKLQFLLAGFVLMIAAVIISGSLIFSIESTSYINKFYSGKTNPEGYAYIKGEKSLQSIKDKASKNDKIKEVKVMDGVQLLENYKLNGEEKAPFYTFLYETLNYKDLPIGIKIREGEEKPAPKDDEIWVERIFAKNNHISLGDTIELSNKKLKVAVIINTSIVPNSLNNITPCLISAKTRQDLMEKNEAMHLVAVESDTDTEASSFLDDALKDFGTDIIYVYTRSDLVGSVESIALIFAGCGLMAAVMIFIVSLVIIKFIIKSTMTRELQCIGIWKALGKSNGFIKGIYSKAYLLMGLVFITSGSFLGIPVAYIMGNRELDNAGGFHLSMLTPAVILTIILLLNLIMYWQIRRVLKRIDHITPVETLRIGLTSNEKKVKKSLIKNAHSPFSMAINDIAKKPGHSIMLILLLSLSIYLGVFFVEMQYSCQNIGTMPNVWFGIPNVDVTLTGEISVSLKEELSRMDEVQEYQVGHFITRLGASAKEEKVNELVNGSIGIVMDHWDEKTSKITPKSGRLPKADNEVVIGSILAGELGYKAGDELTLTMNGKTNTYLIVGTINSLMSGGNCIGFTEKILETYPDKAVNDYGFAYVTLKQSTTMEDFKALMKQKPYGVMVGKVCNEIKTTGESISEMIYPLCIILIIVSMLFCILNIINLLAMDHFENRRIYGILKSLGFTNRYICFRSISKIFILSIAAIVIAVTSFVLTAPTFIELASGVDGLVLNVKLIAGITVAMLVEIGIVTVMFCLPMRKISPKDLMEE